MALVSARVQYNKENWADNEPSDDTGLSNRGAIDGDKHWFDFLCTEKMKILCYNGAILPRI